MKMNNALKEFIERNIDYIQIGDWQPLINSINSVTYNKPFTLSDFFSAMYASRIDPLKDFYINEIPGWFMRYSDVLTSLNIPDNIMYINEYAFANNSNLEKVILPTDLQKIYNRAFFECHKLKSCIIPNNVNYIGEATFADCWKLQFVDLPQSLNQLGTWAFAGCKNLTKVTIHVNTDLEDMVFSGCKKLLEIEWLGTKAQFYKRFNDAYGRVSLPWIKGSYIEYIKCLDGIIPIDRFMRS